MKKFLSKMLIGVTLLTGAGVVTAESASAYSTYDTNQAVSSALYFAKTHGFSMAPLSNAGIASDANFYCGWYNTNLSRGLSHADAIYRANLTLTQSRTGNANKTIAISYGARAWMCRG